MKKIKKYIHEQLMIDRYGEAHQAHFNLKIEELSRKIAKGVKSLLQSDNDGKEVTGFMETQSELRYGYECGNCKTFVEEGDNFCSHCGTKPIFPDNQNKSEET